MIMQTVKSSNIKAAGYDPQANVMRVRFSNGIEYDYAGVKVDTFNEFMSAKSQGRYFNTNIKGKLSGSKVVEDENNG